MLIALSVGKRNRSLDIEAALCLRPCWGMSVVFSRGRVPGGFGGFGRSSKRLEIKSSDQKRASAGGHSNICMNAK